MGLRRLGALVKSTPRRLMLKADGAAADGADMGESVKDESQQNLNHQPFGKVT